MKPGKILLLHPTANENVRETALALAEACLLDEFWTSVNWKREGVADRVLALNSSIRNELRRRSFVPALHRYIHTFGWREWGRQFFSRTGPARLTRDETGPFSMDAVYRSLDRHVARQLCNNGSVAAVYAYDAGALAVFQAAKRCGVKCIYEHPIVYWRRVREIQAEEAQLKPEWVPTLLTLRDSTEKLARKDEELALADVVIVSSTFAAESLAAAPRLAAPVHVIPYGAPVVRSEVVPRRSNDCLRILFVGALTQAKGLSYILEAVARLANKAELTLIGHRVSSDVPSRAALARHRWIASLPHDQLLEEMAHHDMLLFPSLHEGFGLVIFEAMAQGTPVIATPNSGARDIIEDNVDGFLIPIRSADAIVEKLELLLRDPKQLQMMREAARLKAQKWSWSVYRARVMTLAREVMAI